MSARYALYLPRLPAHQIHFLLSILQGGRTPLHMCGIRGLDSVAEDLVLNGADVNAQDNVSATHGTKPNCSTRLANAG